MTFRGSQDSSFCVVVSCGRCKLSGGLRAKILFLYESFSTAGPSTASDAKAAKPDGTGVGIGEHRLQIQRLCILMCGKETGDARKKRRTCRCVLSHNTNFLSSTLSRIQQEVALVNMVNPYRWSPYPSLSGLVEFALNKVRLLEGMTATFETL
eukprot:Gregarina_sp_Poly_1__7937@NODE_4532_length_566_cov_37_829659_g3048_i0_p1_GENE_NODE_4532_length_566_cov_37_829659_g3048_i0NODE_4532_length_566_cov_37_829659_g3048_i0_p1_ORF_typecomplete_len153_score14_42_NODE_4532_length_566_cov_37_829659_g3048_i077535